MPKMKTHRGAAKRFKRRKSGVIGRGKSTVTHNLTSKSSKRKMHLRKPTVVHKSDQDRVQRLLPK
ncbi:MAG: 50S ribosomal protein L35 [Gemmatimonadota bacterium]|nr:50S ribosomal protein L35 [Gemmatimonadota bacterium]